MICACLQHTHLLSIQLFSFYFLLIRGANSATSASVCMSVRMSACLSASISQKPDVRTLAVHGKYGSGSVPHLAALRYAIYFWFMDGIMRHVCTGIGGTKKACAPSNLPWGSTGLMRPRSRRIFSVAHHGRQPLKGAKSAIDDCLVVAYAFSLCRKVI